MLVRPRQKSSYSSSRFWGEKNLQLCYYYSNFRPFNSFKRSLTRFLEFLAEARALCVVIHIRLDSLCCLTLLLLFRELVRCFVPFKKVDLWRLDNVNGCREERANVEFIRFDFTCRRMLDEGAKPHKTDVEASYWLSLEIYTSKSFIDLNSLCCSFPLKVEATTHNCTTIVHREQWDYAGGFSALFRLFSICCSCFFLHFKRAELNLFEIKQRWRWGWWKKQRE